MARFYDRGRGWQDGTTEFHALCAAAIPRGARILEVGAGAPNPTSRFLATLGPVHGLDPDPGVLANDALAEARLLDGERYPYPDGAFDACVSDYVLEHVRDPRAHLFELHRVLRPGAPYVFRTVNRLHYVALAARWTPHSFHLRVVNRLKGLPPGAPAPFPTVYAMNSPRRVARLAAEASFELESLRLVEKEPSYGMSSRALFLAFMAYERAVNATPKLAPLRANIFAVLRRR